MPRKKQQNPQPVKLDSDDGVAVAAPGSLTLESDFLLGQDLEFDPDHDNKILGLEKFSEVAAEIGFSVSPLGGEQSPAYSALSMDSEADSGSNKEREDEGRAAQPEPAFPPYLSCRGCGQLRDEPLGPGIDLVGPYCLRCCKASREAKSAENFGVFGVGGVGVSGLHRLGSSASLMMADGGDDRMDGNGLGDKDALGEDGSNKLHSCHLCGFSSRYANHVKRHMKTHNGEKPYNCPLCTYASAQLVNLQRHLRIHTGEKPYKCDCCTFACSSLGNLKRHQRMHVSPGAAGGVGGVGGAGLEASRLLPGGHNVLKRPAIGARASEEEPSASAKEVVRPASSLHLGAPNNDYLSAFDSLRGAPPPPLPPLPTPTPPPSRHHHHHHAPPPALQPASSRGSTGGGGGAVRTVGRVGDGHHSGPLHPSLFPYTCRLCGIVLEDEDGTSAQICAKCTLDMLTKDSSSPNSPGERSDKVYTCAACPFLTHYPNHLARHMKTHSGEKPYKCPQCDYASAHFDNLKRHHRVHTGEKPYKCHLCDYACGNLANLKRHQRVHSGAKPFQCAVCSYSCNQSMNLKRHMLRHTGEKPYKCQECGYTTGHWDNYKRHQKKHGLATDGWVKVQMTGHCEEEEEDEEEDEEEEEEEQPQQQQQQQVGGGGGRIGVGVSVGVQTQMKEEGFDMQYMPR